MKWTDLRRLLNAFGSKSYFAIYYLAPVIYIVCLIITGHTQHVLYIPLRLCFLIIASFFHFYAYKIYKGYCPDRILSGMDSKDFLEEHVKIIKDKTEALNQAKETQSQVNIERYQNLKTRIRKKGFTDPFTHDQLYKLLDIIKPYYLDINDLVKTFSDNLNEENELLNFTKQNMLHPKKIKFATGAMVFSICFSFIANIILVIEIIKITKI